MRSLGALLYALYFLGAAILMAIVGLPMWMTIAGTFSFVLMLLSLLLFILEEA